MMMMMFLAKGKPCSSSILTLFNPQHQFHQILPRLFSSSPALKNPSFMVGYLIQTFGFSSDKAAKVSKTIAHLKSPENPDSVIGFLKKRNFSDADIKTLVTRRPQLLSSSPQHTLHPNLTALRNMGLSATALNKILLSGPYALLHPSAVSRITFWKDFLDGDEPALVKAFTSNRALVDRDISRNIAPKISLLQRYGFSIKDIRRIICTSRRFITSKASGMEDLLKRTKELGFQPGKGMFMHGLRAMVAVNREGFQKKMDLFKSFGWTEDDFLSALHKSPVIVSQGEESLRAKMDFLLQEARCEPSYIATHPVLLTFSLQKRLRPRNNALLLLETKDLRSKGQSFLTVMNVSDSKFLERYILPYKEEISGLHEGYLAASAS